MKRQVAAAMGVVGVALVAAVILAPETRPRRLHVRRTIKVMQPPEVIYSAWHDFEKLPGFMRHLERVRSEAVVTDDVLNEWIAWRSVEGADVTHTGSVRFLPTLGGRGTEIDLDLRFRPPSGNLAAVIAKLFGKEPSQQVDEDLRQFKQTMENQHT